MNATQTLEPAQRAQAPSRTGAKSFDTIPLVIDSPAACREICAAWRTAGETIALVPTMGALHEGHLTLIRHAQRLAKRVIVSIYVNPLQFGPSEDFTRYPRAFEADLAACSQVGADAIFHPPSLMPSSQLSQGTQVVPPVALTEQLCGLNRPGHFSGVATVVLQLLNCVQPEFAIFGEKDAQQLAVIRRMVQDFHLPVRIEAHPIVREADGLAMSSRNQYLKEAMDRRAATVLYSMLRALQAKMSMFGRIPKPAHEVFSSITRTWLANDPLVRDRVTLEYLAAVEDQTFSPVDYLRPGVRVLVAARVGKVKDRAPESLESPAGVRLIDNVLL